MPLGSVILQLLTIVTDCAVLVYTIYKTMPRTPTAKNWCFTWNNYPDDHEDQIAQAFERLLEEENNRCTYIIFGREVGESGTPHLQGFCRFNKPLARPAQKLWQAHWTVARKVQNAIEYCRKEGDVVEQGVQPEGAGGGQGKRTDLHDFRDRVKEAFEGGEHYTERMARDEFPTVASSSPNFVTQTIADFKPPPPVEGHVLRPWQQQLNTLLNAEPSRREVIFVVDTAGNQGKTWFSKYYRSLHDNVQLLPPGKFHDVAYLIEDTTRVFFLDTPRERQEYFNYTLLEKLKDGDIFSSKYRPVHIELREPAHVVVLMNWEPDMNKLSADRYKIIRLD